LPLHNAAAVATVVVAADPTVGAVAAAISAAGEVAAATTADPVLAAPIQAAGIAAVHHPRGLTMAAAAGRRRAVGPTQVIAAPRAIDRVQVRQPEQTGNGIHLAGRAEHTLQERGAVTQAMPLRNRIHLVTGGPTAAQQAGAQRAQREVLLVRTRPA